MKTKQIDCKTGLKPRLISKEIFDKEMALCQKLSQKKGGKCCWGKCKDCGVIAMLYKLYDGVILEDEEKTAAQIKNGLKLE